MRLVTRADFDGLVCGAVLMEFGMIEKWLFVHPKDMQDGKIPVSEEDILANVPYVPGCKMWFDHHSSETERVGSDIVVEGASYGAPSCARIVYEYFNGEERAPYMKEMVEAADKVDSGSLTIEDIINPQGWVLLGFITDPRTGLGRYRGFKRSNFAVMEDLMDACRDYSIDQMLMFPDVAERVEYYKKHNMNYHNRLAENTYVDGDLIITDLRNDDPLQVGNRFLIYTLYPKQNISVLLLEGLNPANVMISVGHNVLNRTSTVNVGRLMLKYGGGGNDAVGSCQVPKEDIDRVLAEVVASIKAHK
jgi:nanoRNase/pAp phosphatase (c-di-AMP/oligoRNAs hydrolase)